VSPRVPFPRIEGDAYYTPDDVAEACVRTIAPRMLRLRDPIPRIIEPSVGGGAFVRAVNAVGLRDVLGVDINPRATGLDACPAMFVGDFTDLHADVAIPRDRHAWIVGNPPYKHALEHVEHAISLAMMMRADPTLPAGGVGFLLRLAFLEGKARAPFWRAYPPTEVHILTRRPSFTGGKTDSCAYAFFVWCAGEREPFRWIP